MTTAAIRSFPVGKAKPDRPSKVLYLGPAADELCNVLANQIGRVDVSYHADVQSAITEARARQYDVVLVDQRDSNLASQLILPLVASLGYPVKLVVISTFSDIGHYLSVPGVARVLAAPLREAQLLRVLGLERRVPRGDPEAVATVEKPAPVPKNLVQRLSDRFMNLVSTAYKRAAFVLLFVLFVTFTFYGVLIGYFLLSNSWGAPMTLTRGHELVSKAERELTEMHVALNQTEQRITEAKLAGDTATNALEEARTQVKTATGTMGRQIRLIEKQSSVARRNIARLEKIRAALTRTLAKGGIKSDLDALYGKRLINRKDYTNNSLNLIEASQRLASVENEIESMRAAVDAEAGSVLLLKELLESLRQGGPVSSLAAVPPDLLLVVKQALDARTAEQAALSQIAAANETREQLLRNRNVLNRQIADVELSAVGRAIQTRIDVIFVPYTNAARFKPGEKLYSCAFTILWCKPAGEIGDALPGEINAVHPFFGKPIRGTFVEASSMTPEAATREIIHGIRAPFYF